PRGLHWRRPRLRLLARRHELRVRPMDAAIAGFLLLAGMGLPMRSSTDCFRRARFSKTELKSQIAGPRKARKGSRFQRSDFFRSARAIRSCAISRRDLQPQTV